MLWIDCPVCGPRPEAEFFCVGEGEARILPLDASDAEVAEALYVRTNTAGVQHERWVHRRGCGEWLGVTRDTRRNAIVAVAFLRGGTPAQQQDPA